MLRMPQQSRGFLSREQRATRRRRRARSARGRRPRTLPPAPRPMARSARRRRRRRRRRRGTLLEPRDSLLLPRVAAGPAARRHGSPAQAERGARSLLSWLCAMSTGGVADRAAWASSTTATSRRSRGSCSCGRTAPSRSATCAHGRERQEGFIGWKRAPLQGCRRGEARRAHRRGDGEAGRRKCLTFSCLACVPPRDPLRPLHLSR